MGNNVAFTTNKENFLPHYHDRLFIEILVWFCLEGIAEELDFLTLEDLVHVQDPFIHQELRRRSFWRMKHWGIWKEVHSVFFYWKGNNIILSWHEKVAHWIIQGFLCFQDNIYNLNIQPINNIKFRWPKMRIDLFSNSSVKAKQKTFL